MKYSSVTSGKILRKQDGNIMNEQILFQAGVDYEDGLKRFSGNRRLYEKYVGGFLDNTEFEELREAMGREDYEAAFRLAHTLKGLVGNLSFERLYGKLAPFVEYLRGASDLCRAREEFPGLEEEYRRLTEAIRLAL